MSAMLILVVRGSIKDQVFTSQQKSSENFQICPLMITHHIEHTDHDNHLDCLILSLSILFLHAHDLKQ